MSRGFEMLVKAKEHIEALVSRHGLEIAVADRAYDHTYGRFIDRGINPDIADDAAHLGLSEKVKEILAERAAFSVKEKREREGRNG